MRTDRQLPARELQALEEVGTTRISRGWAYGLLLAFTLTISLVALIEPVAERFDGGGGFEAGSVSAQSRAFIDLGVEVRAALSPGGAASPLAALHQVLAGMNRFETQLERESFLRRWLLPRLQWRLAATVGLGNEQVYVGREDWLFFRPDVDSVVGRGFLRPSVLASRERSGDAWQEPPRADPMPALRDLQRQLQRRRIHLIVMPTPVKPSIEPNRFSGRIGATEEALQNPSFGEFLRAISIAGIDGFDPAPLLLREKRESGEPQFLRTDTHWTPAAVDATARVLARRIGELIPATARDRQTHTRRQVVVEGWGDIATMLMLPAEQGWLAPERVVTQRVLRGDGRSWRSDPSAPVLVLGDSFTNVYSDPGLGWGGGAGLAEQLSYYLGHPVDKLAVNAGGALETRRALQRAQSDRDRLSGKVVVLYQFASRELAQGDWQLIELFDRGR